MAATSTSTKGTPALFLPGPEVWEVWKANGSGGAHRDRRTDEAGVAPGKIPPGVRFAYPVATAFAVPFWASTDDPALLEDVGDLQLEKLGLKPAAAMGTLREYRVVDQLGNRSLAVATVLSPPPGMSFSRHPPESFEVSALLYRLPSDAVTVWRELGRLVMAVTRNDSPVYFQALSGGELDAEAIREIMCVLLQLGTQEVISGIDEVVIWLGETRDEKVADLVRDGLRVPARFAAPPPPVFPARKSALVPEEVALLRHRREERRRWRRRFMIGAAFYLVAIALFAGRLILTEREAASKSAEIEAVRPEAEAIRRTQERWDSLRLAIDADSYPIEAMLKCVELLPPRGVRLTEFEYTQDGIFLKGEASSAPEAIKFKGVLTSAASLADYEWNFPPPVIVPNKGATFQTKGKFKYAGAEAQ